MDPSDARYVHGNSPEEQGRLSRLNALLNAGFLDAMGLRGGERILDVGSGLGQFTRILARKSGRHGRVLGIDHDVLRLWPEPPGVLDLWRAYYTTYELHGKNPAVGRHLVSLLHQAGAKPKANRLLFFGSCAGNPNFEARVSNFIGVIASARDELLSSGLANERQIDEATKRFGLANAGFPRPLMWRDGKTHELSVCGVPLGMLTGTRYSAEELVVQAGDVLVFCSDGLMECENSRGVAFGSAGLRLLLDELAERPAQEIADRLNRAALDFAGPGARQADDFTVIVVKFA